MLQWRIYEGGKGLFATPVFSLGHFFPTPPFFATPLTSFINFINFVRPSVHAVLVYAYNPMEQTHNTFNMAWLMQQLTSAYALVEVYPVLQGKLSQTDRRTSWVIGKLHFQ